MEFIADIDAGSIGMHHLEAEVFALKFPHRLPPLLAVHMPPIALRWAPSCFSCFHAGHPR
jgi:hypothetical protein